MQLNIKKEFIVNQPSVLILGYAQTCTTLITWTCTIGTSFIPKHLHRTTRTLTQTTINWLQVDGIHVVVSFFASVMLHSPFGKMNGSYYWSSCYKTKLVFPHGHITPLLNRPFLTLTRSPKESTQRSTFVTLEALCIALVFMQLDKHIARYHKERHRALLNQEHMP